LGVVGSLNALDERAGVRGALGAKRWQARLRLWWLAIAAAYVVVLASVVLALLNDGSPVAALALGLLPGAFYSGFLYNERLRSLGRRPRLLEVPDDWGEQVSPLAAAPASTAAEGGATS